MITVFWEGLKRALGCTLVLSLAISPSIAQQKSTTAVGDRKPKSRVEPSYPDLARRMNIRGVVKVAATVAPNGTVTEVKIIGGHPVLANAAMEAVKKWRFEPAAQETTETLQFLFDPNQ